MLKRFAALGLVFILLFTCTAAFSDHIHSYDYDKYESDDTHHWHVCIECGEKLHYAAHTYANGSNRCTVCGAGSQEPEAVVLAASRVVDHIHSYDYDKYDWDDTHHWHTCIECGAQLYYAEHASFVPQRDANSHWSACTVCGGSVDKENHYALCTDPEKCAKCGMTRAEGAVFPVPEHDWQPRTDANYHWYQCSVCGLIKDQENHSAVCADPEHCAVCGMSKAEGAVFNTPEHKWEPKTDANAHWEECSACGTIQGKENHYAVCADPEHCAGCGMSKVEGAVFETPEHDWHLVSDEIAHWEECFACGKTAEWENHYAFCTDPEHCAGCGMSKDEGAVFDTPDHDWILAMDAEYHWDECSVCGETANVEHHYALCTAASLHRCVVCGADEEDGAHVTPAEHQFKSSMSADRNGHWYECLLCGKRADEEAHIFKDGRCIVCSYKQPSSSTSTPAPTATPAPKPTATPAPKPTDTPTPVPTALPVPQPSEEPALLRPCYIFESLSFDGTTIIARIVHVDGMPEAEQLFIRIDMLLPNGTPWAVAFPVWNEDGSFAADLPEGVELECLYITDTYQCIRPWSVWEQLGYFEF